MTFMVLMKYTVLGFFGSGLLILLAKGIMAHLMQRREDYYEDCLNSSGGGCLGVGGDDTCAGYSNERRTDCNDDSSTDCNNGCDGMGTQGGGADV